MTQLQRFDGMLFQASSMVPEGKQVLRNDGQPVIRLPIGAPIEDAICDEIWLNPIDYQRLRDAVPPAGTD